MKIYLVIENFAFYSLDDSESSSSSEDEPDAASNNPAPGGDNSGVSQRDQDADDRPNYLWKPNDDDGFGEWELHTRVGTHFFTFGSRRFLYNLTIAVNRLLSVVCLGRICPSDHNYNNMCITLLLLIFGNEKLLPKQEIIQ